MFGPHFSNGSSDLTATRTGGATAAVPRRPPAPLLASLPAGADRTRFVFAFTDVPFTCLVLDFFVFPFALTFALAGILAVPDPDPVFLVVSFLSAPARDVVPRGLPVTLRSPVTPVPFLTFPTCSPRLRNRRRMSSGFVRYGNLG